MTSKNSLLTTSARTRLIGAALLTALLWLGLAWACDWPGSGLGLALGVALDVALDVAQWS